MMHSTGGYAPPAPSRADRKIRTVSKGHFTGHLIADDGDHGRVVVVESHLEMLWAVYLLSLPCVATIVEQVAFNWVDTVDKNHQKFFDFVVVLHSGERLACEVKPSVRLVSGQVEAELAQIAAQMTPDFADGVRLLTEKGLDPISTYNAEMFMGMREDDPDVDVVALLVIRELRGAASMAELTEVIGYGARGFRALVRLIMHQILRIERHERIKPETMVSVWGNS